MKHTVKAPHVGESITEVRIIEWSKDNGSQVEEGEILLEVETDKASVEVAAPASGKLEITSPADSTINVGSPIAFIDDAQKGSQSSSGKSSNSTPQANATVNKSSVSSSLTQGEIKVSKDSFLVGASMLEQIQKLSVPSASSKNTSVVEEKSRLLPGESRKKMTRIRKKIADNLVKAQHEAAILTTFNEVDLSEVMDLRKKHKEAFKKKNGVNLGFMSFFTRAACIALKEQPLVNSSIEGDEVISREFVHVGIAVGTERGLVVPVLKNTDKMTFLDIEQSIVDAATKAKKGKLSIADMSNGTFTISNGGVYGSMLSTPILNPPQSAILGMHNIQQRAVVVDGKIVARPMMYLALSYDHRIIDGKEAVSFLIRIKTLLENPKELSLDFL